MGLRVVSSIKDVDYRVDLQNKITLYRLSGDIELGYSLINLAKARLGLEVFNVQVKTIPIYPSATSGLDMPTCWPKNISGIRIHSSVEALENLTVRADYHGFFRSSDDFPIYK